MRRVEKGRLLHLPTFARLGYNPYAGFEAVRRGAMPKRRQSGLGSDLFGTLMAEAEECGLDHTKDRLQ